MLTGVRIVEVEGLGPGPFTGMLLADLGADVIVVHRKGGNSAPGVPDRSLLDRGKRSIELDLKDASDLAVFNKLVATADGLIEGFRPGVMERLGIGPDDCLALNPQLVFGRMTGWGQDSPLSKTAGHDLNYISMNGALWYASLPGAPPMTPATLVGDIGGGAMYLAVGMLAGIMNARSTGRGTVVDAAIYDGSAHMMNLLMTQHQTGLLSPKRGESLLDGPHWSRTYETKDKGFVSVQCLEAKFYALFLEKMGLQDDPDFQQQHNEALWPALTDRTAALFATRTRDAWEALFSGSDACVAPVLTPQEAMAHPMNWARQTWYDIDGVMQAAPAPRFSTLPEWSPSALTARGQHHHEIMTELGIAPLAD